MNNINCGRECMQIKTTEVIKLTKLTNRRKLGEFVKITQLLQNSLGASHYSVVRGHTVSSTNNNTVLSACIYHKQIDGPLIMENVLLMFQCLNHKSYPIKDE
jgi:hypothetical protein